MTEQQTEILRLIAIMENDRSVSNRKLDMSYKRRQIITKALKFYLANGPDQ